MSADPGDAAQAGLAQRVRDALRDSEDLFRRMPSMTLDEIGVLKVRLRDAAVAMRAISHWHDGEADRIHKAAVIHRRIDDLDAEISMRKFPLRPDDRGVLRSCRSPATGDRPCLYQYEGGIIVLADVSAVMCGSDSFGKFCHVQFRSGGVARLDVDLSRSLIQAVKEHGSPGGFATMIAHPAGFDPSAESAI